MASPIREYETTYILTPELDAAEQKKVQDRVTAIITEQFGGEIHRLEDWGKRKLAYPIRKQLRGLYVYIRFQATADTIEEMERILRLLDPVIKFLTINIATANGDEDAVRPGVAGDDGPSAADRLAGSDDDDDDDA